MHGDNTDPRAGLTSKIIRNLASYNTLIEDGRLLERLNQYCHVAQWSRAAMMANLLTEARVLMDPNLVRLVCAIETPELKASFTSSEAHIIQGELAAHEQQFLVPFVYQEGVYVAVFDKAMVESSRTDNSWTPRPMTDPEMYFVRPAVIKLLQNATLLLHEAVIRQIAEFDAYFSHTVMPGYKELARANAELGLWKQPTTRPILDAEGLPIELRFSIAYLGENRESIVQGEAKLSDGRITKFSVDQVLVIGVNSLNQKMIKANVPANFKEVLEEPLTTFFAPRIADWDYARTISDRAQVVSALRDENHPVYKLQKNLLLEEKLLAFHTAEIRLNRLDLDGLKVEARFD